MLTCRQTAFTFIRLCGVCSVNRQTLSIWSRYFKEKYVRNHADVDVHSFRHSTNNLWNACSFACVANVEQATFSHSPRSRMPCLRARTDVDASLEWEKDCIIQFQVCYNLQQRPINLPLCRLVLYRTELLFCSIFLNASNLIFGHF